MNKLLLPLFLIITGVAFGQGSPCPNYQQFGSATTRTVFLGLAQGQKGITVGRYADTTTANSSGCADYYPGTLIVTDNPLDELWQRNSTATKWINRGSVNITSLTFLTDSSIVICFGNGVCDTIPLNNFTTVVNNIITSYLDTTIINNAGNTFVFQDSFLVICNGAGVCDTFNLHHPINNFYYLNPDTIIVCDTPQVVCVGTNCTTQQICDTIAVPRQSMFRFQNGVQQIAPGIVEFGNPSNDPNPSQLQKDTYLYTDFYNLGITGAPYLRPTLTVQNKQWTTISQSIASFNSLGNNIYFRPTQIDNENPVNLYLNYFDPMAEGNGVFAGDTIGTMFDRIGYGFITNAQGTRAGYSLQSTIAKQSGIMFHTFDTSYTDAVTIFGNQVPKPYLFSVSPYPTTTLLDSRIAVFKTTGQTQLPQYISGAFEEPSPLYIIAQDNLGNLVQYPPGGLGGGSGGGLLFARDDARNNSGSNMYFSNAGTNMNWDSVGTWEINGRSNTHVLFDFLKDFVMYVDDNSGMPQGLIRWYNDGSNNTKGEISTTGNSKEAGVYWHHPRVADIPQVLLYAGLPPTQDPYWISATAVRVQPAQLTFALANNSTNWKIGGMQSTIDTVNKAMVYNTTDSTVHYITLNSLLGSGFTADNGLTKSTATNVQLGGTFGSPATFLNNRYITNSGFTLTMQESGANTILSLNGSGGGVGLLSQSGSNTAVWAISTTGTGVVATSQGSAYGVNAQSANSYAIYTRSQPSSTNSAFGVIMVDRYTTGTPANGIGGSIDFSIQTSTSADISNQLISKWTDVTHATRTSQLIFTGVNSAVTADLFTLSGNGSTRLNKYGINTFGGTPTFAAGWDANGNFVEFAVPSGISGITADEGITANTSSNVQLGSTSNSGVPLTTTRYINTGSNTLRVRGNTSLYPFYAENIGSGFGAYIESVSGVGAQIIVTPSSTNTVLPILNVSRATSGTAGDGIGGQIDYYFSTAGTGAGNTYAGSLAAKWTTVDHPTRSSSLVFKAVLATNTIDVLTIAGNSSVKLNPITATAASAITPAEGMILIVNSTDGTFTSTGFWGYSGGAWGKISN